MSESANERMGESASWRMGEWANERINESAWGGMEMTYEEWEVTVHERVKKEPTWEFWGYRKALFFYDLAWQDCQKLVRDRCGR